MISYDVSQYSKLRPGEYDSFYVHLETKNKSFLDMHYYLKSIGIKNNAFMLKLYNTNLIGVDPYDPALTSYQKAAILKECMDNCWYFIREVVRIPVSGANKPYVLHRGNMAMTYLFLMNINQMVELSRQFYKTHSALVCLLWVYNFGTTNSQSLFYHKDFASAKSNLKDLKEIRDNLPSYLQFSSGVGQDGKRLKVPDTVQAIQNPFNRNSISCMASARSKEAADKAGRGATVAFVLLDEFHFLKYNQYLWAALAPAHSRAAINAEENSKPHSMIITSTPGDMSTEEGMFGFNMRNQATPWNEMYYDFPRQQLYKVKDSNTNSPFFMITFSYQQLGGGVQYFNDICRLMLRDWPKIRREVLLEWAALPANACFSKEQLDKVKDLCHDPIRTIFFGQYNQYQMQIYEEIDLRYPPIIGVDVSGALYNDSSAITIIDSRTTRVCAILNCNYIPSDDLADVIYVLVSKYMPNSIVNIERNGVPYFNTRNNDYLLCA